VRTRRRISCASGGRAERRNSGIPVDAASQAPQAGSCVAPSQRVQFESPRRPQHCTHVNDATLHTTVLVHQ
jgi:hypothetical protein